MRFGKLQRGGAFAALAAALYASPAMAIEDGMAPEPHPEGWPDVIKAEEVDDRPGEVLHYPERRSGAGPAAHVRRQPQGVLSGKIIYMSAGHGWLNDGGWGLDRGNNNGMNEDYGNIDQLNLFADYCWNAGATVVPFRPLGFQSNVIVLDQDDTAAGSDGVVEYTGSWTTSTGTPYYSKLPNTENYRFTSAVVGTATATARFRPNIPQAGVYPVYTWVLFSSNRVNQEYIINHAGGATSVRVNHRRVGKGWVWLGNYYFDAGNSGYVEITNSKESGDPGTSVIADAIKFGNGIGSSGFRREAENNSYWNATSQMPSSVTNYTVSGPPRASAYMNNEGDGVLADRVYIGFHSNAGGGRGAVGLYNSFKAGQTAGDNTPNQLLLAGYLGREVNENMRQIDTVEFPNYNEWSNRTSHTYTRTDYDFGEILGSAIGDEMDATIIEVAFHDDPDDAAYMKDAKGRRLIARAVRNGLIRYFNDIGDTPLAFPPDEPRNLRAIAADDSTNDVILTWQAPVLINSTLSGTPGHIGGDAPTNYHIYTSTNGRDFSYKGETGNTSTTYRITGIPAGQTVYAYVAAVNAAGSSFPSNVAGSRPGNYHVKTLVVDGFDRIDHYLSPKEVVPTLGSNPIARIYPRLTNDYSYVVPTGNAIAASSPVSAGFDYTVNDHVISGAVKLSDYDAVVWFLGEESTDDETFSAAEQTLVTNYLAAGGKLFVSGAEIGWDLDNQGSASDRTFYNSVLRADYVADASNTYSVVGSAGSIFSGLSITFDNGTNGSYQAEYADRILASGGSTVAMTYSGGSGGNAAVVYNSATTRVVHFAFPFETIVGESNRTAVMSRILEFFAPPTTVHGWMLFQ